MDVFAIGDLHLSGAVDKPMDVFGPQWENHQAEIEQNWRRSVGQDDVVLIPGDLSWAMKLEEARPDLDFIDSLPGVKFFIRGNHDYWCSGPKKVRETLGDSVNLIRFDARVFNGVGICGVRGWPWPGHPEYDPEKDEKHWQRAQLRLEMSLNALQKLEWNVAIAMMHYPPVGPEHTTVLADMIRDAGISYCVYGHLHGESLAVAFEGERDGVQYRCVSADHLAFRPAHILSRCSSTD